MKKGISVNDIVCCCDSRNGDCIEEDDKCPCYIECHKLMGYLRDRNTKPNCLNEIMEGEY